MARKNKISGEDLKEKKLKFEKIADNLEEIPVDKFLKDNFLPYAWSYNLDRALVDVSGLKPVQRRILYTMFKAGLSPNSGRQKVATLGGKVLEYHPHGNISVEDALKNMARPHIFRVPLISGKGDFGVPGTPGAAGRYIEAKLNKAAWLNVEEIAENAVHMVPNYDNSTTEPVKIPVKWPVGVINGGAGIAIAYSSKMPSHNPTEIMKASKLLLRKPDASHAELQKIILGPDFNMGGLITSNDGIKSYLETGSGSFKIRGQYEVKPGPRSTYRIEFYEIPFGTHPEKIISELQANISDKGRFKEISSYKDLSDLKHPIRVVIETKPAVNYKKVLQDLFKYTSLEISFSANITTIVDNKPEQSSMKDLLLDFINFRKECWRNKTMNLLPKRTNRLHLVEGLMKALLDIDKAIAIIRNSEDSTVANGELQKAFNIDEPQADYVLSLQLRKLTKMDKHELEEEKIAIEEEIKFLNSLLSDEEVLKAELLKEFDATLKVIGDERRTEIMGMSMEEFVEQEKNLVKELRKDDKNVACYLTRFADGGLLKSEKPYVFDDTLKVLKDSPAIETLKVKSQEHISIIGSNGMAYRIPLSYVPFDRKVDAKGAGVNLPDDVELVAVSKDEAMKNEVGLFLATKKGEAKIVKADFPSKTEFSVIKLTDDDEVISGEWLPKSLKGSYVTSITSGGNILVYDASTIRVSGASAGGVKSQKLRDGETVIAVNLVENVRSDKNFVLSKANNSLKLTMLKDIAPKGKGSQGVALHKFGPKDSELLTAFTGDNLIATVTEFNNIIQLPPVTPRAAKGIDFNLPIDIGRKIGLNTSTSTDNSNQDVDGGESKSATRPTPTEASVEAKELLPEVTQEAVALEEDAPVSGALF